MFMVNFVLTQPLVISILAESAPLWREAVLTIHSTKCIKYIKQIKKIPNIVYTISYRHPGQEHPKSPKIRAFIISSARCSSDDAPQEIRRPLFDIFTQSTYMINVQGDLFDWYLPISVPKRKLPISQP